MFRVTASAPVRQWQEAPSVPFIPLGAALVGLAERKPQRGLVRSEEILPKKCSISLSIRFTLPYAPLYIAHLVQRTISLAQLNRTLSSLRL